MEKSIQIKGKNASILIEGDSKNPAIIFLHDIFTSKEIWNLTINNLKNKFYCVAVDLPGFGSSEIPKDEDFNLVIQSQKIIFISEFLGLTSFSLAGLGMGANICLYIAGSLVPNRIEKLIVINSLPTGSYSPKLEQIMKFINIISKSTLLYKIFVNYIKFGIKTNSSIVRWLIYDKSNFQRNEELLSAITLNPIFPSPIKHAIKSIHSIDLTNNLRNIKAETLIIGGKNDQLVSIDQSYLCQTLIPKNNLAIIEKCGHFPMIEKTNNYFKALKIIFGN